LFFIFPIPSKSKKLEDKHMSEEKIYRISIRGELVEVNRELYLYFYRSRRRIDYYEHDIKTEVAIRDENGEITGYMPSKEDSLDRIIESGVDFCDGSESIEDLVIRKLMAERLKQCLLLLEPDERRLIDARYFEGKTEMGCAQICGVNQSTISRREAKILAKLKKMMEK